MGSRSKYEAKEAIQQLIAGHLYTITNVIKNYVMKTPYRGLGVCPNRRDENSL